jgi:hypothetical protein
MGTMIYNDRPAKQKKPRKEEEPARVEGPEPAEQVNVVEQKAPLSEVKVRVVRIPANPRLLLCEIQESGSRVLVRVRSNVKFRKGMELAAVPAGSETEVWNYEGAMPRHMGRW